VGAGDHGGDALTPPTSPLLAVDALVAGYTDPVVGPVSFALNRGEIVGLAGANGSGKTTVLSAIVGSARVFGGTMTCDRSAGVSVLRQFPVHLTEMPITTAEFLRVAGASTSGLPEAFLPLADVRVDRLSGGQFQLLQAWACLGSPAALVLLDEPTNNMDPQAIAGLAELLIESRTRGKGVLVISHEPTLLDKVCTRVIEVGR
jgi:ATPase subunit of ABC transporter with duplicated ATPase domains